MADNTKIYGTRVIGFYSTSGGGFKSLTVNEKTLEALQTLDVGSQLWFYENTKRETSSQPEFNLVFYTAEQVAERKAEWEAKKASGASPSRGKALPPAKRPAAKAPVSDDLDF